jgi:hemerythrin-like domain-containing protein
MPRTRNRTAENDAIALLKADHKKARSLLGELENTSARATTRREELLQTIERELKIHTTIEEEIFYPAFRETAEKQDDKRLFYEAVEEHHVVDTVLGELLQAEPASEQFGAKAKVLKDLVEHHAEEEETEMLPRARKLMTRQRLVELGERLAAAKLSLTEKVLTKLVELVRP